MSARPLLHGYFRSSSAWRVRLALGLKGIEFDTRPVNLLKGEHREAAYRALNPMGAVPMLEIDGHRLTESMAILEYLEETRPAPALLPSEPLLRAKVRELSQLIVADVQPVQNLRVLRKLELEQGLDAEGKAAWARHWISEGFQALERLLQPVSGLCAVGDEPTFADLCLVPQVYNARRFGVDMSAFPLITRLEARLSGRSEFVAAHPSSQPDCPAELR